MATWRRPVDKTAWSPGKWIGDYQIYTPMRDVEWHATCVADLVILRACLGSALDPDKYRKGNEG